MQPQRSRSTSPHYTEQQQPPMTYDEVSMQRSRNFATALQELKNLRPQLYSAAEYCESSYLYSDQKHVVLDNLKDYSIKALVNAVDHLGTVAYKLNDLLSQQTTEISTAELRVSCLAQRIHTCHVHTNHEGIQQQRIIKTNPRYHKHYVLPDAAAGSMEQAQERKKSVNTQESQAANIGRTSSFHLATEAQSTSIGGISNLHQTSRNGFRSSSSGASSNNFLIPGVGFSSSGQALLSTPGSNTPQSGQGSSAGSPRSMSSVLSFDDSRQNDHRRAPTRSKSLLSSLLGRRRSGKGRN